MNEAVLLSVTLAVGVGVGTLFYGGLWWTVRCGLGSSRPALWFMSSLLLRASTALVAFDLVARDDWRRWAACLGGFAIARLLVKRVVVAHGGLHAPQSG